MNALKLIVLAIVQTLKQACFFPQALAHALKQRRRLIVLDDPEIERLDRLRNPSKYLGK